MADINKVTIDEARYDELRKAEKYLREHPQPPQSYVDELEKKLNDDVKALLALTNERDELKEKLDAVTRTNNLIIDNCEKSCAVAKRLAAAERCIETIASNIICTTSWENKHKIIEDAIRAYREKKEAK